MLNSKQDFVEYFKNIIEPLPRYYTNGCAGIQLGNFSASYTDSVSRMEAFARILWGLGPLWGGGESAGELDGICLQVIINGTNPEHEEYWGDLCDYDQRTVETAAIGLALILAPHKIWDPLTDEQKDRFAKWLYKVGEVKSGDNNWQFFPAIANLGLKSVGAPYRKEVFDFAISRYDAFYRGGGWYHDGNTDQADYYIAWAIHFYSLIYARVMENEDPENSKKFKERAMLFAKDFIYWFDEDGSAIAIGRSLTYRFAQCSFFSACVFAGIEPFSMGVMKGIISRHLEWWASKPIFDNGGVLSVGYAYPNLLMSESYNAFGSPYWALKSMLVLALEENHEFFRAEPLPLPKLDSVRIIPQAKMVIQRINGYVVALTSGQWALFEPDHVAEKYSKFAYSSRYAFSVPHSAYTLFKAAPDSMLAFEVDKLIFTRRKCEEYRINDDGTIYSKWSPYRGICVETTLIPTDVGHVRRHTVTCDSEYVAYDCAFATPSGNGCELIGEGTKMTVLPSPNTNLMNPKTTINAIKYCFPKGTTTVETTVIYPK